MNIWLITTGEPITTDGENPRLLRTGILANLMAKQGHQVTWWNSTFDHNNKIQRAEKSVSIQIQDYRLVLLKGCGYKSNISFSRLYDHYLVGKEFKKMALQCEKSDIIVVAFPTFSLCLEALILGKKNNIPVLIDYRDLWPEAFVHAFPNLLQPFAKIAFSPMYIMAKKILSKADGILSITQPILDIALAKAKRKQNQYDNVIPLGYQNTKITADEYTQAQFFWKNLDLNPTEDFIICFFGQIGHQFDFDTIIETAQLLEKQDNRSNKIKIIICGRGDKLEELKEKTKDLKNIILPGLINAAQIQALMKISKLGLAPYKQTIDFNNSLPNKTFEYMSAGLPIITSLHDGYLGKFLNEQEIGFTYKNSDDLVQQLAKLEKNQSVIVGKNKVIIDIFEKSFSAETVYHNYMKHLESVILNFKK